VNASLQFDAETLTPTYRLLKGVPGRSYGLAIARRLGVPADVLREAAVVCCHGGSGTTFGTLAAGVPLVILPMFADQPANGRRLTATGAGLVVEPFGGTDHAMGRFGPADVPRIRAAIEAVLGDISYRTAASRVADEMGRMSTVDELISSMTPNGADDHA